MSFSLTAVKRWKIADVLSYLKFSSNDNKAILNSSSMFSGKLGRNILDFMNDEEELLITFEKDTIDILQPAKLDLLLTFQSLLNSMSWKHLLIKNMMNM